MATAVHGRLQTPKNDKGERKDIMLMTTAADVIVSQDSTGENVMLDEKLVQIVPQYTDAQPSFACLWARPAEHLANKA
jgi:hypothetical protein